MKTIGNLFALLIKKVLSYKVVSKKFLVFYLRCHFKFHERIIALLGKSVFNGLHPKNVFNFRSDFFKDNVCENDVVVDIACGTGSILKNISSKIAKGYGIDYSSENLHLCKKFNANNNIEFIEADIYAFDFSAFQRNTGYTVAILSHILEHIYDVPDFLGKINADLVLICVPSQENWRSELMTFLKLPNLTDATHYREYTRKALYNHLTEAQYDVEYLEFNSEGEIICRARQRSSRAASV